MKHQVCIIMLAFGISLNAMERHVAHEGDSFRELLKHLMFGCCYIGSLGMETYIEQTYPCNPRNVITHVPACLVTTSRLVGFAGYVSGCAAGICYGCSSLSYPEIGQDT
jgi:hypothetical protein